MDSARAALDVDLRAIVAGARALGVEGLDEVSGADPRRSLGAVWQAIMGQLADPLAPFWVGVAVPFGGYELVDYLCGSCATLGDALRSLDRYYRLISRQLDVTFDGATLTVRPGAGDALQRSVLGLYCSGVVLGRLRQVTGREDLLVDATLAVPSSDALQRWLGAPARSGGDAFRFRFRDEALAAPLTRSDPTLTAVLERYADELLERRSDETDPLGSVRRATREELRSGEVTLEQVARRLGTSERTLQRRLAEASTTFRDLLGEERMTWARHLLGRRLAVGEVAYLLGYSEQSAFARAFRRWTGQSPRRFQQQLAQAVSDP